MDAFEQLASELFFRKGYWVQNSLKVDLSKAEKVAIGRPSSPRWEIDLVAYSGGSNRLLALECKSFLDSNGVSLAEFRAESASTRYKLFRENETRETVLRRMKADLVAKGFIPQGCEVHFGLVAAKVRPKDSETLPAYFAEQGWHFYGPHWIRTGVTKLASSGYSNDVGAVVAKILLR
ncbi:MAG: hypothetical protein AAF291_01655 [Pseudomonadota bacterium]